MQAPTGRSAFVPLLCLAVALVAALSHQAYLLSRDAMRLTQAQTQQLPVLDKARQVRDALDKLAAQTQRLADAGNPNAKLIVDELRKRGITINPNAQGGNR